MATVYRSPFQTDFTAYYTRIFLEGDKIHCYCKQVAFIHRWPPRQCDCYTIHLLIETSFAQCSSLQDATSPAALLRVLWCMDFPLKAIHEVGESFIFEGTLSLSYRYNSNLMTLQRQMEKGRQIREV